MDPGAWQGPGRTGAYGHRARLLAGIWEGKPLPCTQRGPASWQERQVQAPPAQLLGKPPDLPRPPAVLVRPQALGGDRSPPRRRPFEAPVGSKGLKRLQPCSSGDPRKPGPRAQQIPDLCVSLLTAGGPTQL